MKKVIVVTGASSGFGALASRALATTGHAVYAAMRDTKGRNAPEVALAHEYAAKNGVDLRTVELDVVSDKSVDAGIGRIIAENGRLDVIVHNAGHMVFGPAEAFTPEQLAELYDVNVLSRQRVNRAALPQLRKQKQGLVVWVSSSSAAGGRHPIWRRTSRPTQDGAEVVNAVSDRVRAELLPRIGLGAPADTAGRRSPVA